LASRQLLSASTYMLSYRKPM